MRTPRKGEVLGIAAAIMSGGGLVGCGGASHNASPEGTNQSSRGPAKINKIERGPAANTTPFKGVLRCIAINHSTEWAPTPTNMNAPLIAQAIGHGVTAAQVEAGQMGTADCAQGIEVGQVDRTKATVKGIGDLCIVVGLGSAPRPGKTYHEVLTVCAAESVPVPTVTE